MSDISLLQASMLAREQKVDFGMEFGEWLEKALAENLQVLPVSLRIAVIENELPRNFHGDPADRIIASTAIAHQLTLVTPDRAIMFSSVCETISYKWPRRSKRRDISS